MSIFLTVLGILVLNVGFMFWTVLTGFSMQWEKWIYGIFAWIVSDAIIAGLLIGRFFFSH